MPLPRSCDPLLLLQDLIQFPSVTPNEAGIFNYLTDLCEALGFQCTIVSFGDKNTGEVKNFYAHLGKASPRLLFAGHVDVVPPGSLNEWRFPPFSATLADERLYGRGAVDMKGGLACFLAAVTHLLTTPTQKLKGSLCIALTADEEGPAINGTQKLLSWAKENKETWDYALVGEPSCEEILGDTIKVGRRGSLSAHLRIIGQQGHVAYPQQALNPLNSLAKIYQHLSAPLDEGTENFSASHLELTSIDTQNTTTNIIPHSCDMRFNIRYAPCWTQERLQKEIEQRIQRAISPQISYQLNWLAGNSEAFYCGASPLTPILADAIKKITTITPKLSTSGGTSDARFIKNYCPVIEFSLINKEIHKINENVEIKELNQLTKIYQLFLEKLLFH